MKGAYYNEIDPYCAAWLRNLISAGHIAPGDVDERSIVDVRADDLAGYTQCHFFAGIAGWSLALRLAGWPDDRPVWTGSCPCQPFSLAGAQKGFADDRHLWPVWRDLISERRPAKVFGEQVASATEWLRLVRSDLEAMGYAVGAMPIQAASAGADHLRDRFWFVADADFARSQGRQLLPERADQQPAWSGCVADAGCGRRGEPNERQDEQPRRAEAERPSHGAVVNTASERRNGGEGATGASGWDRAQDTGFDWIIGADGKARRVKSGIRLLAHGVPARVGRLRAYGNAIVPTVAAEFIRAAS